MDVKVVVKEYKPDEGLALTWQPGARIQVRVSDGDVVIKANRAGLESLANHLLTLAQDTVPEGEHLHLDDSNALEDGSCPTILEKRA
jgi:hypothetical protein